MRLAIIAILIGCLATAADAVPPPPSIKEGTRAEAAWARLAQAGIEPARLTRLGHACASESECASRGARLYCGADIEICFWLFARRSDDALFVVSTGLGRPPLSRRGEDAYLGIEPAACEDLEHQELELILPSGRCVKYAPAPYKPEPTPPRPEPPRPLCADVPPGTLPCWIEPPPGYRPPTGPRR